jgi:SNF2 family DNA or RNA helicase
LEEIFLSNEKVVIFTSFRKMIETICRDIRNRFGVYTNFIDGSVPAVDRQKIVDEFSLINGAGLLVLNPKAAGAGLNITCANHAIHYKLEWNPAIEDQASARIYRRGQNKTVFVYRLYYVNTIEEIINDRIQKKRTLSENAIIGTTGENTDQEYILKALEASPYKNSTI